MRLAHNGATVRSSHYLAASVRCTVEFRRNAPPKALPLRLRVVQTRPPCLVRRRTLISPHPLIAPGTRAAVDGRAADGVGGLNRLGRVGALCEVVAAGDYAGLVAVERVDSEVVATDARLDVERAGGRDGGVVRFDIDPFRKHCLLNGLDDMGLTLQKEKSIKAYEEKAAKEQPWA